MRKILFRGKRIDNGEWAYGYYGVFGDTQQIFVPNAEARFCGKPIYGMWHIVNSETVGEFTGLTDKNGTKVFEGDIVEFDVQSGKTRDVVVWSDGEYNGVAGFRLKSRALYSITSYNRQYFEVVGNIYDNADLLEGKNG